MAKMGADWAQAAAQYGKDNADAMLQSTDIGIAVSKTSRTRCAPWYLDLE
jgi:hypothetical protein